jgi:2-methylcitrate dehydratase PrpD
MTMAQTPNADAAAHFIATAPGRNYPADVVEAARMALVDTIGVALGAHIEGAGQSVRRVAGNWGASGEAQILLGGRSAPAVAALVNATLGHCLDYDDTHVGAVAHLGNPTWATALAVGQQTGASDREILGAFITGFEVGARLGGGLGHTLNERGFHSTGLFGCFASATAAAVLLGLDEEGIRNALGAAATQAAGLTASFGTMSKPFHAGKAAMNGILAAELAKEGFEAAQNLIEAENGFATAYVQDGSKAPALLDFDGSMEITRNTLKPYASCLLTHPVIDAARALADAVKGHEVAEIAVEVNPICIQLAGKPQPQTGLEGKFSTAYCAALGLTGHMVTAKDFAEDRVADPAVRSLLDKVTLTPAPDMHMTAAKVRLSLADGTVIDQETPLALGNPGNPMDWDDIRGKFTPLAEPVLGEKAETLYELLRNFGDDEHMTAIRKIVAR